MFRKKYNGLTLENLTKEQEVKLWDSRELALGSSTGSKITEIPHFYLDQGATGSCTVHALFFMFAHNKVMKNLINVFSLYRKRFNFPGAGSNPMDMVVKSHSKFTNIGGTVPIDYIKQPSHLTDEWANTLNFIKGVDLLEDFNYFTVKDYGDLERVINSGIGIVVGIYATFREWSREYVEETDHIADPFNAQVRHAVELMPYGAFWENGKLWFSVLDSSPFGNRKIRYVTLPFLINREIVKNVFATPNDIPTPDPIKDAKPTVAVKLNDRGRNVEILQSYLAEKGFLDKKYVTGFYGQITRASVLHFQLYYHKKFSSPIPELLKLNGEYFGSQSIQAAKDL